jgi:hypothetical protein
MLIKARQAVPFLRLDRSLHKVIEQALKGVLHAIKEKEYNQGKMYFL